MRNASTYTVAKQQTHTHTKSLKQILIFSTNITGLQLSYGKVWFKLCGGEGERSMHMNYCIVSNVFSADLTLWAVVILDHTFRTPVV